MVTIESANEAYEVYEELEQEIGREAAAKAATKKMMTVGKTFPCRTCKTNQPHTYGDVQEFPGKRYALWNCCICGDTRAERIYDAAEFSPQEESEFLRGTGRL